MAVKILCARVGAACAVLSLLVAGAAAQPATAGASTRVAHISSTVTLDRTLSATLGQAGGSASALVVDESTGQTLFAENPTTPRLPASVEKLFTTSAALFDFGSAGRFSTGVYGVGTLSAVGTFSGTLYLRGGGDPTFGDQHFDAAAYDTGATVQALCRSLRAAGIKRITGTILGDASIFDDLGGGPDTGFAPNLETEGELSGLSYDAGFTNSDEIALQPDPALWAARAFASVAPHEGVAVARGTRVSTGVTPAGAHLYAQVRSPTIATLIQLTNAPSDNFFAETLDKDLGHRFGTVGSTVAGAQVVTALTAAKLGVSERANDGSGLSRFDRTTATAVVELLEEMQGSQAFVDSLAVAARSGTMVDEMLNTAGANNCRGKTGTLHDVANLVGYCTAANGDQLAFAFLENGLADSTYGHETEDIAGEALAGYDGPGTGTAAPMLPDPNAGAGITSSGAGDSTTASGGTAAPGSTAASGGAATSGGSGAGTGL